MTPTVRAALIVLAAAGCCLAQTPPRPPEKAPDRERAPERAPERGRGAEVDLRPKFEKGQEIRFRLDMSSSTSIGPGRPSAPPRRPARPQRPGRDADPAGDEGGPSSSKVEMGLRLKVTEVSEEGGATVDLVIDRLKATVDAGGVRTQFDSTKPSKDSGPAAAVLRSVAGTTMTLKVDEAGNITSVKGGEGLAALGQLAGGAGGVAGAGGGKPADLFSGIFSAGKTTGKAKVGESWEHTDTLDSPLLGGMRMTTRHTLTSHRGGEASIDLRGRIEPSSESPGEGLVTIKESRHDGKYVWDTRAGMLRRMESAMTTEMEAKLGERELLTRSESKLSITRER